MKALWVLKVQLDRLFDKQKIKAKKMTNAELEDHKNIPIMRIRVEKGTFKDKILFAVFESVIREEFDAKEVQVLVKEGLIERHQIGLSRNGTLRTVFCHTEKECEYQPNLVKRWSTKAVQWIKNSHLFNRE